MEKELGAEGDGGVFRGLRLRLEGFYTEKEDEYREHIRRQSGKIEKKYDWMGLYFVTSSEKVLNLDPIVIEARKKGAIVVNELWLDDTLKDRTLADTEKILYRPPLALGGLKGAQHLKIAHIGFCSKESEYIERLVDMIGAENVDVANCSYLLCNTLEEYKATKEMRDLFRVNKKWLEDTVTDWAILSVDLPRYTSWPRTARNYRTPVKDESHATSQREYLSTGSKSTSQLGKSFRGSPDQEKLVKRQALSTWNKKPHPPSVRDTVTVCNCKRFIDFNCQRLSDFRGNDLVRTVQIPGSRKEEDVGSEMIKGALLGCYTAIIDIHSRGDCIRNTITASSFMVSVQSYKVTLEQVQLGPFDGKIARENKDDFVKMVGRFFSKKHRAVPADIGVWLSCINERVPDRVIKNHVNMLHPLDLFGSFTVMYYVVVNLKENPEDRLKYLQIVDSQIMVKYKSWLSEDFDWDVLHDTLNYIHPSQLELDRLRNNDKDTGETIVSEPKDRVDDVFGLLQTIRNCFLHPAKKHQLLLLPILLGQYPRLLSDLQRRLFELGHLDNLK